MGKDVVVWKTSGVGPSDSSNTLKVLVQKATAAKWLSFTERSLRREFIETYLGLPYKEKPE